MRPLCRLFPKSRPPSRLASLSTPPIAQQQQQQQQQQQKQEQRQQQQQKIQARWYEENGPLPALPAPSWLAGNYGTSSFFSSSRPFSLSSAPTRWRRAASTAAAGRSTSPAVAWTPGPRPCFAAGSDTALLALRLEELLVPEPAKTGSSIAIAVAEARAEAGLGPKPGAGGQWRLTDDGQGIERVFEFRGFGKAWDFMSAVSLKCKVKKHHPEWSNAYNKVFVRWTTHEPRGLTMRDLELAAICDVIAEEMDEVGTASNRHKLADNDVVVVAAPTKEELKEQARDKKAKKGKKKSPTPANIADTNVRADDDAHDGGVPGWDHGYEDKRGVTGEGSGLFGEADDDDDDEDDEDNGAAAAAAFLPHRESRWAHENSIDMRRGSQAPPRSWLDQGRAATAGLRPALVSEPEEENPALLSEGRVGEDWPGSSVAEFSEQEAYRRPPSLWDLEKQKGDAALEQRRLDEEREAEVARAWLERD